MLTITAKTRKNQFVNSLDELVPIVQCKYKTFKRLTETSSHYLQSLIDNNFTSTREDLFKHIAPFFKTGSGAVPNERYVVDFGWTADEIKSFTDKHKEANKNSKTPEQHRQNSVLCVEYYTSRGFTEEYARDAISKRQSELSKRVTRETRRKSSQRTVDHWLAKGLTNEQAVNEVSRVQKLASPRTLEYWIAKGSLNPAYDRAKYQSNNAATIHLKYTEHERRSFNRLCKEYWEIKGYTPEEIAEIQSNNGRTFSLDKCIEKYGEIDGYDVWLARQEKWLITLNNKTHEEQLEIHFKKTGTLQGNASDKFYIIELSPTHCKVGITKYSGTTRFGKTIASLRTVDYQLDSSKAVIFERAMKQKLIKYIGCDEFNELGWTEVVNLPFVTVKTIIDIELQTF